ncbi:MAG: signal peptidase II [Actinobacteria bacterium]|nr:signal peptidase II [Actinomycetota bacterium]
MTAADARRPHWTLLGAVVAAVLVIDQLSKNWALSELGGRRTIEVLWTLQLRLAFNTGMAFSLGGNRGQLIAAIAVVVVGWVLFSERRDTTRLGAVARGLIVGGAAGNLIDRLLRDRDLGGGFLAGRVVDFIDFQWWPVFNGADAAVVVGVVLLIVTMLFWSPEDERRPAGADRQADLSG